MELDAMALARNEHRSGRRRGRKRETGADFLDDDDSSGAGRRDDEMDRSAGAWGLVAQCEMDLQEDLLVRSQDGRLSASHSRSHSLTGGLLPGPSSMALSLTAPVYLNEVPTRYSQPQGPRRGTSVVGQMLL